MVRPLSANRMVAPVEARGTRLDPIVGQAIERAVEAHRPGGSGRWFGAALDLLDGSYAGGKVGWSVG